MQASERSVTQDITDARLCAAPYLPEHNVHVGMYAAVMSGNHSAATSYASMLRDSRHWFPADTISAGMDVVSQMEVDLQFGRCACRSRLPAGPSFIQTPRLLFCLLVWTVKCGVQMGLWLHAGVRAYRLCCRCRNSVDALHRTRKPLCERSCCIGTYCAPCTTCIPVRKPTQEATRQ